MLGVISSFDYPAGREIGLGSGSSHVTPRMLDKLRAESKQGKRGEW